MGRRGPAPTPTKVKILRGETRPSRVNYREPIPSSDVPKMPTDMDAEAKVVWRRVISSMGHTALASGSISGGIFGEFEDGSGSR